MFDVSYERTEQIRTSIAWKYAGRENKRIEGNATTVGVSASGSSRDSLQFYSAECLVNWPLNFLLRSHSPSKVRIETDRVLRGTNRKITNGTR